MPHHVIVDGSNLATEGRTQPSLKQLNEAVASYRGDHPDALLTIVVDATFGHRIDSSESAEFEREIETNAFVAPPAGAVGRGDGFILSIAQKVNAVVLSNDSYQEFHGEYAWLFDRGRLIGGKPVPHVGWVFVERVPVRGPVSRRSVKEQKIVEKSPPRPRTRSRVATGSISADAPMPVPTSAPPGAVLRPSRQRSTAAVTATVAPDEPKIVERSAAAKAVNELMPFLTFVQDHPVGSPVDAVVDHYSSHGAYVAVGDVIAYLPLRLMADPAPRSAREIVGVGESVSLVVHSFTASRRSIDLAMPAMAPEVAAVVVKPKRASAKKQAVSAPPTQTKPAKTVRPAKAGTLAPPAMATEPVRAETASKKAATKRAPANRASANQAPENKAPENKAANKPAANKPAGAKPAANKLAATKQAAVAPRVSDAPETPTSQPRRSRAVSKISSPELAVQEPTQALTPVAPKRARKAAPAKPLPSSA